ncbi:unnamed protein product [Closterium sp. Yama58-4]|nr:unnamed protein product [Closterium sp. Yama58-4]
MCGKFHTPHHYFSRLDDAWRQEMGDDYERPRWAALLNSGVDIFALDFDAIIAGMYALSTSVEGDCYLCAPYDPGIEAAALGASESAPSGTAPAEALHTFTLDSDSPLAPQAWSPLSATPSWYALASSGLWSSLPPSPAPPCIPCVEGRQRAAPHSSSFPPTIAPLQTLHMDVWGPTRVQGVSRERYFLLVVDDYSRYTTVFPLRRKGEVPVVLIRWIRAAHLQLREPWFRWFRTDLPVLRLHSDRGGEFSSGLLRSFCDTEGIHQSFTLPASPQQNGIAERRIGLVMEVARTSMIHAAAPHFLWPFAVRYAAHQLNLWPRVSLPETSPTLRWTGEVGDASRFRVWGSCAFVRDSTAGKLSSRAIPCVFLGFPPDVPGWQFYHPTAHHVFASQDVTFDESVPFYRLFPHRTTSLPPPPLFLAPGPPPVDPLPPQGPAPSGVSQVDPPPLAEPVEVTGDSGAAGGGPARGTESGGAEPWDAEPGGVEPGGAEPGSAEPGGAEPGGAEPEGAAFEGAGSGVAEPGGAASARAEAGGPEPGGAAFGGAEPGCAASERAGPGGAEPGGAGSLGRPPSVSPQRSPQREPLSPQQLREWLAQRTRLRRDAARAGDTVVGVTGPGVAGAGGSGAGDAAAGGSRAGGSGAGDAATGGAGAGGSRAGDAAAGGAGAGGATGAGNSAAAGAGGAGRSSTAGPGGARTSGARAASAGSAADPGAGVSSQPCLFFAPPSPTSLPPPDSVLRQVLTLPSSTSLPQEDLECLVAALPHLVAMLLAPKGDPDALDIPNPRSYAEAIEGPYSSQWQTAMDAKMASWKSTGTYVDEVPPPGANIVDGMWIFRVKRPPGSPPVFKARYVARGFSQQQGADFFQTFSPNPKMTTLRVLLHVAAQRDYELHSLDFSTAFLQGSLHEEIWLRRPPGFTGSFPPGTQWSLCRPVYTDPSLFLRTDTSLPPFYIPVYVDDLVFATADTEALALVKSELQKRHTCTDLGELRSYLGLQITRDRARRTITLTQSHMVQQILLRFGFTWSSPQSTPMATGHSLSALPSDESVVLSGPYPKLVGCLMYLMTCSRPDLAYPLSILARYVAPGRHRREHWEAAKRVLRYLCSTSGMGLVLGGWGDVVLTGHSDASWVDDLATQRSSQGYTFSLGSSFGSWRSTRSSSVLSSSCEAEIYATAMVAQELRWLTYLLTDMGEMPRSPPVLYVDNKAAITLCQEHRLEHRTKHIALRYFLARELQ